MPKTCATNYHSQIGPRYKGCAFKGLIAAIWNLFALGC